VYVLLLDFVIQFNTPFIIFFFLGSISSSTLQFKPICYRVFLRIPTAYKVVRISGEITQGKSEKSISLFSGQCDTHAFFHTKQVTGWFHYYQYCFKEFLWQLSTRLLKQKQLPHLWLSNLPKIINKLITNNNQGVVEFNWSQWEQTTICRNNLLSVCTNYRVAFVS